SAQHAIGAPVLGELHRRPADVARVVLELAFEALEQGEGVGGGTREARQHGVVVHAPHLARVVLDHRVAHGDLAVGGHHHLVVAAHRDHGGGSNVGHGASSIGPA